MMKEIMVKKLSESVLDKIYVLLYAHYDDCYILGAYSSRELANTALKKMSSLERSYTTIHKVQLD